MFPSADNHIFVIKVNNINVLTYYKKCMASLFTDRAIAYRKEQGFDQTEIALSVDIQKMIRSDIACADVAFSLNTESGFPDVVMLLYY